MAKRQRQKEIAREVHDKNRAARGIGHARLLATICW